MNNFLALYIITDFTKNTLLVICGILCFVFNRTQLA